MDIVEPNVANWPITGGKGPKEGRPTRFSWPRLSTEKEECPVTRQKPQARAPAVRAFSPVRQGTCCAENNPGNEPTHPPGLVSVWLCGSFYPSRFANPRHYMALDHKTGDNAGTWFEKAWPRSEALKLKTRLCSSEGRWVPRPVGICFDAARSF